MIYNNKHIKNIIFDLGGVLLDIDPEYTYRMFRDTAVSNTIFDNAYQTLKKEQFFENFEEGKINRELFRTTISEKLGLSVSGNDIDKIWNTMIINFRQSAFKYLPQLKEQYNTFVLSNTNEIHEQYFREKFAKAELGEHFEYFFNRVYLSHRIGIRKPKIESFEYVIKSNNLDPAETLFIDDTPGNTEAAVKCGLHAYLHSRDMDIMDFLLEQINKD